MESKRIISLLFASALAFALTAPALAQDSPPQQQQPETSAPQQEPQKMGKSRTYMGEIMDSACAKVGSHDAMMKQEGASNAKECTDKCVQMGSKYVLHNSATKRTYQLDDQDKAKEFSGQKVKVTGHYDRATKTVHVESVEAAS